MTDRLLEIYSQIPACSVFADIGCDHGYISLAMISNKKCNSVIIADVSEKCLEKAKKLLSAYIEQGSVSAFVADGFKGLPKCDTALIAGMGGEEIVSILKSAESLPKTLVLQPMKNVDKVRRTLIELGFKVEKDYVFFAEEKFYDLIVAVKGEDGLTSEEIEFGRTNLLSPSQAFRERIKKQINGLDERINNPDIPDEVKKRAKLEREKLEKYV